MSPTRRLLARLGWREARKPRSPAEECLRGRRSPPEDGCDGRDCDSIRLTELREGSDATVSCLTGAGGGTARTLASLGVLPGVRIRLVQRFPAYVVRLDHAELALDRAMAETVRVRPAED